MEESLRVRQKTLGLKEALTGDSTNDAKPIIAAQMGPIRKGQDKRDREDAHFAPCNDISEQLLVCAAGNVF